MKLKNAPGRKNQRRINALERLRLSLNPLNPTQQEISEIKTLESRIIDPDTARNIHTKKRRGDSNRGRH